MNRSKSEIVGKCYELAVSADYESLASYLTEDFFVIEADALPYGGVYRGLDGLRTLLSRVTACWGGKIDADVETMIADGDWVVALAMMKGVRASDGERVEVPLCELWKFRGDRICEIRPFYFDSLKVRSLVE